MIDYAIAVLIFTGIYGFIALGLNIQWGMAGLINLGQVAFFAIGAYTTALLTKSEMPFGLALILGGAAAGAAGAGLALATPRLKEDYLAIVTLGFSELVRLVILNEKWIAGGADGVAGIPRPLTAWGLSDGAFLSILVLVLAVAIWASWRIEGSPFGRVLNAIREDEIVVESVGKSVLHFKVQAFVAGAILAGVGGGFFATYLTYISPDMFGPNVSIIVLAAVLLARQGSTAGALAGIAVVTALVEGTRLIKDYIPGIDGVELAALRIVLLGLGLMAIVVLRYGGRSAK